MGIIKRWIVCKLI